MRLCKPVTACGAALTAALISTISYAQDDDTSYTQPDTVTPSERLEQPSGSGMRVTNLSGVGGAEGYAQAGVLELGGSASLSLAEDFVQVGLSPSVGWFLWDNVQLSALIGLNYVSVSVTAEDGTETDTDTTLLSVLVEPSYHVRLADPIFGFVGLGLGLAFQSDPGAAFEMAARVGINVLVGRSGIFTPAFVAVWQTTEAVATKEGAVVPQDYTVGLQAGYTVMW
jgi:hypothetical protein